MPFSTTTSWIMSLFSTPEQDPSRTRQLQPSPTLAPQPGVALGGSFVRGLFMPAFAGRGEGEEEQQRGGSRQQPPTLELSMTLLPPRENINHFIHLSSPLQFPSDICSYRLNAALGIRFP